MRHMLNINEDRATLEALILDHKIKTIRLMKESEYVNEGWVDPAIVVELDNGVMLFVASDMEGSDHGMLFGHDPNTGRDFILGGA